MEGDLHIILNVFSSSDEVKLNSKMEYVKLIGFKTKLRYDKLHMATHLHVSVSTVSSLSGQLFSRFHF